MGIVSVPSFGADPVTITGPTLDAKVDGLATEFNGNIENANIKADAAIAYAKLNIAGLIDNDDIKSDAAIVATKLATIATAGKVSGAALTLLGNIPSAAGILPPANTRKVVALKVTADADTLAVGDGIMYFTCPAELTGMNLVAVGASTITAGTGVTVMVARGRRSAADGALSFENMLSTAITIDTGEFDSANAAAAAVIDTAKDDIVVTTYVDVIRIDVDVASGAGLEVRLSFQTP